jgi:hypothetical protein
MLKKTDLKKRDAPQKKTEQLEIFFFFLPATNACSSGELADNLVLSVFTLLPSLSSYTASTLTEWQTERCRKKKRIISLCLSPFFTASTIELSGSSIKLQYGGCLR